MQSEKSVEIEHGFFRDVDGRAHSIVAGLAVRDDDVEAVGCSALEDDDQAFVADSRIGGSEGGARQEAGESGVADYGHGAVAEKNSSSYRHKKPAFGI